MKCILKWIKNIVNIIINKIGLVYLFFFNYFVNMYLRNIFFDYICIIMLFRKFVNEF